MIKLENTIPPPIVGLACALLTWVVAKYTPGLTLEHSIVVIVSAILLVIGASFDIAGIISFRAAKTTVNPLKPDSTSALVQTGIYKLSRNPMYTGLAIILTAWSLYLGSIVGLMGTAIFVAYINHFQIKPEERVLTRLFGDEFIQYQTKVRRWL